MNRKRRYRPSNRKPSFVCRPAANASTATRKKPKKTHTSCQSRRDKPDVKPLRTHASTPTAPSSRIVALSLRSIMRQAPGNTKTRVATARRNSQSRGDSPSRRPSQASSGAPMDTECVSRLFPFSASIPRSGAILRLAAGCRAETDVRRAVMRVGRDRLPWPGTGPGRRAPGWRGCARRGDRRPGRRKW